MESNPLLVIPASDIPVVGNPLGLTQLPAVASPAPASDLGGLIQFPENTSYIVLLNAQESSRVVSIALQLAIGSASASVVIDGNLAKLGVDTVLPVTPSRKVTSTSLVIGAGSKLELVLSDVSGDAEALSFAFGIQK